MPGSWKDIKTQIVDLETHRGTRSVPLRRAFNRDIQIALRAGGMTRMMLTWLTRQVAQLTPWSTIENTEAAGNYIYHIVDLEWRASRGAPLPDTPATGVWARRKAPTLSTLHMAYARVSEAEQIVNDHLRAWLKPFLEDAWRPQWLQLARGVWRGQEAGDFLQDPLAGSPRPKAFAGRPFTVRRDRILGVMGDGDCFYRALGVGMILSRSHIGTLIRALGKVEYKVSADSMGLCMVYPKPSGMSSAGGSSAWNGGSDRTK